MNVYYILAPKDTLSLVFTISVEHRDRSQKIKGRIRIIVASIEDYCQVCYDYCLNIKWCIC